MLSASSDMLGDKPERFRRRCAEALFLGDLMIILFNLSKREIELGEDVSQRERNPGPRTAKKARSECIESTRRRREVERVVTMPSSTHI